jgi:hypothetical protein
MSLKGSLDGFNSKVRELKLSIENLNNYENGGVAISALQDFMWCIMHFQSTACVNTSHTVQP